MLQEKENFMNPENPNEISPSESTEGAGEATKQPLESEVSPEAKIRGKIEKELDSFEVNAAAVDKASSEFDGPKEMAALAEGLPAEQRRQLEEKIVQVQRQAESHKTSAVAHAGILNPKTALGAMLLSDFKFAAFLGYASGAVPAISVEEFLRNGALHLRDKYKLASLGRQQRKLEKR